ncbi:hypothetical protein SCHPADRAFT_222832 [Schizopora paradoxa]|uniref:Uncharacterized protein n=1 Tax=Schizopora paradoxa TaxID=27342 RepID=A0A0H2RW76_9AGAM|nr:hypothetical protein SCHPADRAFT_222832 [Schizopora paradoxa]
MNCQHEMTRCDLEIELNGVWLTIRPCLGPLRIEFRTLSTVLVADSRCRLPPPAERLRGRW